jgi:adenosylhomocysteine nucleosidase
MEAAVRWALGAGSGPQYLLVAGFSGALLPGRPVGHLVLAYEVVDEHGGRWPADWPPERRPAGQGGRTPGTSPLVPERGRVLTADALAADPAGKRALGVRYVALAVDMESAAAARLCRERGVPCGCLRAVSDDADTALSPELAGLLRAGRPSPGAVLRALLRRPALAAELRALARNTRIAAGRLAGALGELL